MICSKNRMFLQTIPFRGGRFLRRFFVALLSILVLLTFPGIGQAAETGSQISYPSTSGEQVALLGESVGTAAKDAPGTAVETWGRLPKLLKISYPFYNESIGAGVGVGLIGQGSESVILISSWTGGSSSRETPAVTCGILSKAAGRISK